MTTAAVILTAAGCLGVAGALIYLAYALTRKDSR